MTAIVILSIALGSGANAAIFTLVDQVLLRVLPVRQAHELVQVTFTGSRYGNNWGDGTESGELTGRGSEGSPRISRGDGDCHLFL